MRQIFTDLLAANILPTLAMLFLIAIATINYQKNRIKKYQRNIYMRMLNNANYSKVIKEDPKKADKIFFNNVEPKILKMAFDFFDAKLTDKENFNDNFINTYLS